ncbi:hypothetical protein B0I37DRAFT_374298 [Chaetomium sp. MPI-CAGE-AT-0009]|nr:hypothetical protein B0I37DRAFT_374298 [Chaetomium sp. MPI-CAGE-AT-0009]
MTNLTLQDLDPSPRSTTTALTSMTDKEQLTFLDPIPSYEESIAAPRPNALQILGATFGGVVVTPEIQKLVGDTDRLALDLRTLHVTCRPDPAPGKVKVLTILYRFDDDIPTTEVRLLLVAEDAGPASRIVRIDRHMTGQQQLQERAGLRAGGERYFHGVLERPWRAGASGEVDILAVVFGPKRVEDPAVLSVLANHFEGRWGQVRMTNAFFGKDPWPYKRKSWTVYFRFVGSQRVQVVTGWEDGALEVPWSRHL